MTFQFCIICFACIIIGAMVIDLLWTMFILRFFLNEQYTRFTSLPIGTKYQSVDSLGGETWKILSTEGKGKIQLWEGIFWRKYLFKHICNATSSHEDLSKMEVQVIRWGL